MSTTQVVQAITTLMLDNLQTIPGIAFLLVGVITLFLEFRIMLRDRDPGFILYMLMSIVITVNLVATAPTVWNFLRTAYYKITEVL